MTKIILGILLSIAIIISSSHFEQKHVKNSFSAFEVKVARLISDVENNTATKEEVRTVLDWWEQTKELLHIFIPHNDITYLENWLSESEKLVEQRNFELAASKLSPLLYLCKSIPKAYKASLENIL